MLQKIRPYWYLFTFLFVLLGFTLSGWGWVVFTHLQHVSPPAKNAHNQAQSKIFVPLTERKLLPGTHLIIPALGINAPIEAVGITTDGAMDVPTQHPWVGVGWYEYGSYPGATGSAVLAGHLNRPDGKPAIFWRLHTLRVGDLVLINDGSNNILRFRVIMLKSYTPNSAPKAEIFGKRDGKFLNLITCAGKWLAAQHQMSERLVVYTELLQGN